MRSKFSIVAMCDMGVLLLVGFAQPQLEYPFLPLTQNLLREFSVHTLSISHI